MAYSNDRNSAKRVHISNIFQEYTKPSRLLQSFTNLSNTVIQTALSGQTKFLFEILQNADDAFEDPNKEIEVTFILHNNYFIVHHTGKGFDYNDVERICDYASQIEEVKATDLSKTGYKGLGFKSLFTLSNTIYIHSNGYSFRFDKTYWSDWQKKPWQIIPIWCLYEELPLYRSFPHDQPVNIILKVNDVDQLEKQIRELIIQPDLLLFLHRINKLCLNLKGEIHFIERSSENFGVFNKIIFSDNNLLRSTWLARTYVCSISDRVKNVIKGTSQFIYPDKIKKAEEAPITFAVRIDENIQKITNIKGLLYCTLPTQLKLTLPYHINSFFILNLDRSQLHENEWNEFLIYQLGSLQLHLLKDIAGVEFIKNQVINIFCRKIDHPLTIFCEAFLKGYSEKRGEICWLPSYNNKRLLSLHEAWIDEIEFFKQRFKNIQDGNISPYLIRYDLENSKLLTTSEDRVSRFNYQSLFKAFENKYFPQLTKSSYSDFINYLYLGLNDLPSSNSVIVEFKKVPLLKSKNGKLMTIQNALFEKEENTVPEFLNLNPVDNIYLPLSDFGKNWFVTLGASFLNSGKIIQESVLKWIKDGTIHHQMTLNNHIEIMDFLAKNMDSLTINDTDTLKKGLLVLTLSNEFKLAKNCYFPDAVSIKEFSDIISKNEIVSSVYDRNRLHDFFVKIGVCDKLKTAEIVRKSILIWIKTGVINNKITKSNYENIIEYLSDHYSTLESEMNNIETSLFKKMIVLTLDQSFQPANFCIFDSVIPKVKGLQDTYPKNQLVPRNQKPAVISLLSKIGVSDIIEPMKVITETVLKWIREGAINNRITKDNHLHIIEYISEHWPSFKYYLSTSDKELLQRIPILTESNSFRMLQECYLPVLPSDSNYESIPKLKCIIPNNEIISSDYNSESISNFLRNIGVRDLIFANIYEKYSDHLNDNESLKWFFSKIKTYWQNHRTYNDKLLDYLKRKFTSLPRLLTQSGLMCKSVDIYSSRFNEINDIVSDIIPLLSIQYENVTEEIEKYFGFKNRLDLKTITQLINALEKKGRVQPATLETFYSIILKQLKLHDKDEVKKHDIKLFSVDYKLKPAKSLYYFEEKEATCHLKSFYLNRFHLMSHEDTLELARLCGANVLPFQKEILRENEMLDNTLKEFYLDRLPFIAIQEARRQNEKPSITLVRLYEVVNAIKLYKCKKIQVQYPFGPPVKRRDYFDGLTIYVYGKWTSKKSKIHDYIKGMLGVKNILYIIDMDVSEDIEEWLEFQEENRQEFDFVEKELSELMRKDFFEDYEPDSTAQLIKSRKSRRSKSRSHGGRRGHNRSSSSNLQVSPLPLHNLLEGVDSDQHLVKWLGEMCVFNYLQNHYKNKYPKARSQLTNGLFFLQKQSRRIEISWMNEKGDRFLPYDLLLEKDDDIKWLIKVKSTKTSIGDSFSVTQSDFVAKHEVAAEEESIRIKKFCLYNIFLPNVTTSNGNLKQECQSYVLYKTVLHKNVTLK